MTADDLRDELMREMFIARHRGTREGALADWYTYGRRDSGPMLRIYADALIPIFDRLAASCAFAGCPNYPPAPYGDAEGNGQVKVGDFIDGVDGEIIRKGRLQ